MESDANHEWFKVATAVADIPFGANGIIELLVNHKMICLVLYKGKLSATTATCPHAGAKLCNGFVDAVGNLVCPLHHYRFKVQNGRNTSGEGYFLKIFRVEIRPDGVFIGMAKNKAINF